MMLPAETRPHLTVIDGPRPHLATIDGRSTRDSLADEARIETMAFFDEVQRAAAVIVNAVTGLPVPSMVAINEAQRIAHKARLAHDELVALTPEPAA